MDTPENLEQLPELEFEYSPETELEQVKGLLRPTKRKFFVEKKYKVDLPKGVSLEDEREWLGEELLSLIESEIDKEKAFKIRQEVEEAWPWIIDKLKQLLGELELVIPANYRVRFTNYGPGGQFNPPNGIILSISDSKNWPERIPRTLVHEAIHDAIHHLIKKYGFDSGNPDGHWVKEHIVDRLMKKVVPDSHLQKTQLDSKKIEKMDKIFDQYYPNLEKILEEINKQIYDKQN
ncbi:MAG: hypothetical protein WC385_00405 [Candidatus Paceibacterota bacterium]|jgi:hypothetical protein